MDAKEGLLAQLKEKIRLRNMMGGALYWNVLNDECWNLAERCKSAGCTKEEIYEILEGG